MSSRDLRSTASGPLPAANHEAQGLPQGAVYQETHVPTDCVTCGGNGKVWNGLLQEYRPCVDCSAEAL